MRSPSTNSYRLFHGAADGIDGLVIEKFADVLIVQMHEGVLKMSQSAVREICEVAMRESGARSVYRKMFPRDRSGKPGDVAGQNHAPQAWLGVNSPAEITVRENGLRFYVRPYDGYSVGLFLEQRDNRAWVRQVCAGMRVLNLFAYTCGFGVATGLGGASECVNVDISKRYLEWGKQNLSLNGIELDSQRFILSDSFEYLRRARRQGHAFDLVILDPPSFGRDKRSGAVFSIQNDLARLVDESLERLRPGGMMLLCTNHRGTTAARLADYVEQAAARHHRTVQIEYRPLPRDFAGDPDYAKSLIAGFDLP